MKKIFINELEEHIGEQIVSVFYVASLTRNINKQGTSWTDIQLVDKTGRKRAKMWSEFDTDAARACNEAYVTCKGTVDIYNGIVGLAITEMSPADPSEYVITDFAPSISEKERDSALDTLAHFIERVEHPGMRNLLKHCFNERVLEQFCTLPAGIMMHHAYNGALLIHTMEVVNLAVSAAEVQNKYRASYSIPVNMDLVIAGALLHDYGKIMEYKPFPVSTRTLYGKMIGHVHAGAILVSSYGSLLKGNERFDMTELLHIILSSHGEEGGMEPMTQEAMIVHNADMQSAGMDGFSTAFRLEDEKHPGMQNQFAFSKFTDSSIYRRKEEISGENSL